MHLENRVRRKYVPVPLTAVSIEDEFWKPRLEINRTRTIPAISDRLESTGRLNAFNLNWRPGDTPVPHIFWDSDVAKWIEAASYALAANADPQLAERLARVVALVVSAQQPDGYLNVYYTAVEPGKRWTNLRDRHELYCAGHLIEAGVAHYRATRERILLDAVCRYADYIGTVFGPGPGYKRGYPGHPEIELALVRLYRATGERRYLKLARYFVDERGRQPYYFDLEAIARGDDPLRYWAKTHAYTQSHLPVREQQTVTGHAVRAMYLFSAMADLAGETGDASLLAACERLWRHLASKLLYLTGGIGTSGQNEGFTVDYDLPNETAYAETCASIGLVFWNHRLLQLDLDRRYADLMERALYNGVLAGVSLDGERFFYENPLASAGGHHRQPWFECACCPPNLARLFASFGQYVYSQSDDEVCVHLFVGSTARLSIGEQIVKIKQETIYPWSGRVEITVEPVPPISFTLALRLPGWCREPRAELNGEVVDIAGNSDKGYLRLARVWQPRDSVRLEFAMPVERIHAHPDVSADAGRVALQRGPIVYCIEQADHDVSLGRIVLSDAAELKGHFEAGLLGGVGVVTGEASAARVDDWDGALYRAAPAVYEPCALTAVPYYAWDNRAPGPMRVWLPTGEE